MTLTSTLVQHRAALAMLSTLLEQNRAYVEAIGYPTGKACPHCAKEVFANAETLEQLASAPPGTGLAHDHCHAIVELQAEVAKLKAEPKLTLVQLPNPKAEDQPKPEPQPEPEPAPEPAPKPAADPPKEDTSACA